MQEQSKFWDKIADKYSKQPIGDEESYQYKLETTRELLKPDMELLEFGCGTGNTAVKHAPFVKHIHAIDISSGMLEFAKGNATDAGVENISFEQAGISEYDPQGRAFDVVLGLSVLHLLDDKENAISRIYEMLKPGGRFISSTVCAGDNMAYLKPIVPIGRFLGLMPSFTIFSTVELVECLTSAGFEIDHQWQPGKGKAVFIVARKAG